LRINAQIGDVRVAVLAAGSRWDARLRLPPRIAARRRMTDWLESKLRILVTVPSHNLLQFFRFSERCNFWRLKYALSQ